MEKSSRPGFGSSSNNFGSQPRDNEFGQWEMYTKGIGSKLLSKMGYQPGKGLGKNQQGITAPIEVKKRPGSGAIGAYGPEAKGSKKANKSEKENDNDDDIFEVEDSTNKSSWKKGQGATINKAKIKKVYTRSSEDVIAEGVMKSWNNKTEIDDSKATRMKIIDMTGPEQRILSGLSQLHTSRAQMPKDDYTPTKMNTKFDVPELKHNLERMIRISVNKLVREEQNYQRDLKQTDSLKEEETRLEKVIANEEWQLEQLDSYDTFVQTIEDIIDDVKHDDSRLSSPLDTVISKFESFYSQDFKKIFGRSFGLDNLLISTLGPLLRKELRFWKPFATDNDKIHNKFERIKYLVCRPKTFDIILWDYWNPQFCRALQQWPTMKQYKPIMFFMEQWKSILPKWYFEYIVANHLILKIMGEVQSWEPSNDPIPIHEWILPWPQSLLDESTNSNDIELLFEPIYEIVRQKLAKTLGPWEPKSYDNSVLHMISLWKDAFTQTSFQNFIEQNIVPKLEIMMRSIRINPQEQSFAEWNWVMTWRPLLTDETMANILEKCFFPNWLFTLYNWLAQVMVNFVEIQAWYREWKDKLHDLVNQPTIKDMLNKALMMMHHRVDPNICLKPFNAYFDPSIRATKIETSAINSSITQPYVHAPNPTPIEMSYTQSESINFREMVEMKANENGIIFMPIANRYQDGKQVFQCGQYLVYIDNQVLFHQRFVNHNRIWAPIRLQEMIDMCKM
ncbi:Tuftelin-interacting protein 11 [Blomia tropicalis]|nr:Tuftelin-interacting protein 11 [Blomia tropicalis]